MKNKIRFPKNARYFLYALLCTVFLIGCTTKPMEKPFVIIKKEIGIVKKGKDKMYYRYQDKNGRTEGFFDDDIYAVGDTIK